MKKGIVIEFSVSPWQVFNDNFPEQYTITKKISCFSPQNKNKFRPPIKNLRTPHEKIKQLLLVFEKPKEAFKQHTSDLRKQENYSVFKKTKQGIDTGILQGWYREENQEKQKLERMISQKQIKSVKQTPKQGAQNNRSLIQNSKRKNRKITNKIDNFDNQIFIRRQMYSIKSNQKLKSNKQLILPKIRLCTIE